MRPQDILPEVLWVVDRLRLTKLERVAVARIRRQHDALPDPDDWTGEQRDSVDYMLEDIGDIADAHCPAYCYFGAHEGDGSDVGVWVDWDAIEDATRYEDIRKVEAGATFSGTGYVLEVNDHGNAALWHRPGPRCRWREVWSVV